MHACIGEGNGNPLQYSSLENPRDRGAWWAAVYGVTQSDMTEAMQQQQQQRRGRKTEGKKWKSPTQSTFLVWLHSFPYLTWTSWSVNHFSNAPKTMLVSLAFLTSLSKLAMWIIPTLGIHSIPGAQSLDKQNSCSTISWLTYSHSPFFHSSKTKSSPYSRSPPQPHSSCQLSTWPCSSWVHLMNEFQSQCIQLIADKPYRCFLWIITHNWSPSQRPALSHLEIKMV